MKEMQYVFFNRIDGIYEYFDVEDVAIARMRQVMEDDKSLRFSGMSKWHWSSSRKTREVRWSWKDEQGKRHLKTCVLAISHYTRQDERELNKLFDKWDEIVSVFR